MTLDDIIAREVARIQRARHAAQLQGERATCACGCGARIDVSGRHAARVFVDHVHRAWFYRGRFRPTKRKRPTR